VLAATVKLEKAGAQEYQNDHMGRIFDEGFSFSGFERDKLYLNDRGGTFVDISGLSGLDAVTDGRGAAYADFDNDGDYDVFLTSLQGQVHHLFRNNVGHQQGFIRVSLEGTSSGRDAYGAEVRIKTSQGILTRIKAGGSGFVSQSDPRLLFGLGGDPGAEWLEVRWPSGTVQRFGPVDAGSSVEVVEGGDSLAYLQETRFDLPDPLRGGDEVLAWLKVKRGDLFPSIPLIGVTGGKEAETEFGAYRSPGRRYLINLWATWCGPCLQEMPHLEQLYGDLEAAGVDLIGVSLDVAGARAKIPSFLRRLGITYPVFTTRESSFEQLYSGGELVVPLSFIVGGDGRIERILSGWSSETEAAIERLMQ
jgi:thiol-disulfide isomerase/thioredoxin